MTPAPAWALMTPAVCRHSWPGRVGGMLCVLLLWSLPGTVAAASGQPVVDGVGVIVQNNQAVARTRAIQEALRKAIEHVVTELLDQRLLVEQRQILQTQVYARPERFIRSYRVLWEYPDMAQKVYRVALEADVVSAAITQVMNPSRGAPEGPVGAAASEDEKGWILLRVVENQLEQAGLGVSGRVNGVVAAGLRTALQTQGLRLVTSESTTPWDGQESSALMTARVLGARVVLIGRADVEQVRSDVAGVALQAVEATVQVRAFVVQTGERLALERVQTTALHTVASLAGKQALEKAAVTLATRLAPVLQVYAQQLQDMASPSAGRVGQ